MPRRTLLTFVGLRDPFYHDQYDDGRLKGPVLTVLDERTFDRVVLFGRLHREEHLERTRQALRELHPKVRVETQAVHMADSTSHPDILAELRRILAQVRRDAPADDYSISLIAGTPEIHACWVLIAAANEFPARLLNFRRTVHNRLAGPRTLRELDWSEPLAAIKPETLSFLARRGERLDDTELQSPATAAPRNYFARRSLEQAILLGRHDSPVLVRGEPGTQKHYMAALIHQLSNRQSGPLIIVNCATLPSQLVEVVLFGEPGEEENGKLHQASGGTLVLLKIQQVPEPVLVRLLKALDDGYYYGGRARAPIRVNVRLVGTTDRDLENDVRLGHFPAVAWQRLQAGLIHLPSLRERPGDIPLLAREELERLNRAAPRPKRFSPAALARLESHHWPSNVSELRRVVEQAVVNAEQSTIQASEIDLDFAVNLENVSAITPPRIRKGFSMQDYLRTVKHELVRAALAKTDNNQSEAARLLGITPQAVSKYLRERKR